MSPHEEERLEQLNDVAKEQPLTRAEQQTLLDAYSRSILRRAQALALLRQRGHDVAQALQPLHDT